MTRSSLSLVPVLLLSMTGCLRREEPLTRVEAQQAYEEMTIDSQAQALTANTVEITTNFEIGDAVERAAEELRAFIQAELPCADVTLSGNTLTVEYGAHGTCLYRGNAFTGTHTISVSRNTEDQVVVDHVWEALSNGNVTVDGTATVTWDLEDPSRHVQHDLTWTRTSGRTGEGTGDRIQRPLGGSIANGFTEDGHRSWRGEAGTWDLDVSDLEVRWVDPLPQKGTLTLDTPFDKTVSVTFSRKTDAVIHVTVEGARGSFGFDVKSGS